MINSIMTISGSSPESHPASGGAAAVTATATAVVVPNLGSGGGGGGGGQSEVVFVKCDCCGLTEECTETYIAKVRDKYKGRWICGLCAEAVKDEIFRSGTGAGTATATADHDTNNDAELIMISTEEALTRHMNFCNKFRSSSTQLHPPPNPTKHLISAMKQLLRRSLSSSTTTTTTTTISAIRSTPTSPNVSESSCFPTLAS